MFNGMEDKLNEVKKNTTSSKYETKGILKHDENYNTFPLNEENIDKENEKLLDYEMVKKIISLSLTSIGVGFLVCPSKVQYLGIALCSIIFCILIYTLYNTSILLVKIASNLKIYNYTSLIKYFYGKKIAIVHWLLFLLGCLGISILYELIGKDLYIFIYINSL